MTEYYGILRSLYDMDVRGGFGNSGLVEWYSWNSQLVLTHDTCPVGWRIHPRMLYHGL